MEVENDFRTVPGSLFSKRGYEERKTIYRQKYTKVIKNTLEGIYGLLYQETG